MDKLKRQKGFAAYFLTIIVLIIVLGIMMNLSAINLSQQKITNNIKKSDQAYSAAEAGAEDAIVRLKNGMVWSSPYSLSVGNASVNVEISNEVDGYRTITATGNIAGLIRKVRVVYGISTQGVNFHYGIQVGDLGLVMSSNAIIHGNVFSNGPISGASNTKIYGDTISAGPSGSISNVSIKDDEGGGSAWAASLSSCDIEKDAHYTSIDDCNVDGSEFSPENGGDPQSLPITPDQIVQWKADAAAGDHVSGYSIGGNSTDILGPMKVIGDMTMDSNAIITLTGTIWVTGNLTLNSNSIIQLDPDYAPYSGVIIVDGTISLSSNATFCGSEGYQQTGKCKTPATGNYIMLLSTKTSSGQGDPAITSNSNTKTAILYAENGYVRLNSSSQLKEATGRGIIMDSNAVVTYETGLADARFSSGPGGGWKLKSWQEIE